MRENDRELKAFPSKGAAVTWARDHLRQRKAHYENHPAFAHIMTLTISKEQAHGALLLQRSRRKASYEVTIGRPKPSRTPQVKGFLFFGWAAM